MASRDNDVLASLDYEDDDNDPDYVDEDERSREDSDRDEDVEMDDAAEDDDDGAEAGAGETVTVSLAELLQMASGSAGAGGVEDVLRIARSLGLTFQIGGGGGGGAEGRARREREQPPPGHFAAHAEPQPAGVALLHSGEFGTVAPAAAAAPPNVVRVLRARETAQRPSHGQREQLVRPLVPNSNGTVVALFEDNIYSGQYSDDGNYFYTCCRDFRLDIFSTVHDRIDVDPRLRSRPTTASRMKSVSRFSGSGDGWTVTDSHLSPDNERLIYATMSSTVYLTRTGLPDALAAPDQTPIRFRSNLNRPVGRRNLDYDDVQIWSCRFSADGNEIVAGGSSHIFVYDLLANKQTVSIPAHEYDINSCCWADTASGNVLISASDDCFLKVWDRRSLGTGGKPSGVLIGHVEGITYVSPKGDGRYVISNGKDQTLRLWDLRMMRSNEDYVQCRRTSYSDSSFDYRYGYLPVLKRRNHPQDCSVMHYRGHEVLRTLIRCHFSPAESTGQSYIYSGSSNGNIHIWSLDGTVVQVIDRAQTLPISFDPSGPDPGETIERQQPRPPRIGSRATGIIVRDLSWHPTQPVLLSSAWESKAMNSNVARHEWKGLCKNAASVRKLEDWVRQQSDEAPDRKRRRVRMPGEFRDASDDE